MSHTTLLVISKDCESMMNALLGEQFDSFDEQEDVEGVCYRDILTIGDVRNAMHRVETEIGAVSDHGKWYEVGCNCELKRIIGKYDDNEPCKCYDIHI